MGMNAGLISCLPVVVVSIILSWGSLLILDLVYKHQPTSYIDEIFHIPQAQAYCRNEWATWDNKITTLPGLYLVSYAVLKPLEYFSPVSVCTVYNLRLTNLLATFLNFILSFVILTQLDVIKKQHGRKLTNVICAFNIAIFPPLYFFSFLYYTDVWSMTFVLLMYQQFLSQGRYHKSIGFSAAVLAILMRQTNVIWVGFLVLNGAWSEAVCNIQIKGKKSERRKMYEVFLALLAYLPLTSGSPPRHDTLWKLILRVLSRTYHLLTVCCLFVLFVFLNGSIVVGDRHAHQPVLHLMQNLYFLLFAGFFGLPFFVVEAIRSHRELPGPLKIALSCGVCTVLSETNKLQHPYLLADNRHLAFYLWRRVLGHRLLRPAIAPLYVLSGVLLHGLLSAQDAVFMVSLALCTFVNLTPQYLFELRYFILPYLMCRLHFRDVTRTLALLETVLFTIVNFTVLSLFVNRTFTWDSEPGAVQRIIW